MADIPTTEPTQIRAGDTIQWTRDDLTDYPATSWTLRYTLINATAKYQVTATASGVNFAVTILKATSAAYLPGDYSLIGEVYDSTYRYTIKESTIKILPDLSVAGTTVYDHRTDPQKVLDAIDAMILGRATAEQIDVVTKASGDKNIQRKPELLLQFRDVFKREVTAEKMAAGLAAPRRIGVRFKRI